MLALPGLLGKFQAREDGLSTRLSSLAAPASKIANAASVHRNEVIESSKSGRPFSGTKNAPLRLLAAWAALMFFENVRLPSLSILNSARPTSDPAIGIGAPGRLESALPCQSRMALPRVSTAEPRFARLYIRLPILYAVKSFCM